MYTGELITKDRWEEYVRDNSTVCLEYIIANEQFVDVLKTMMKNAKSCTDLEKDLSDFIKERNQFTRYASKHLP